MGTELSEKAILSNKFNNKLYVLLFDVCDKSEGQHLKKM